MATESSIANHQPAAAVLVGATVDGVKTEVDEKKNTSADSSMNSICCPVCLLGAKQCLGHFRAIVLPLTWGPRSLYEATSAAVSMAGVTAATDVPILEPKAIEALAARLNNRTLFRDYGRVDTIHENGKWRLYQKSGDAPTPTFLSDFDGHLFLPGFDGIPSMRFPETDQYGHTFVFVTHEDAFRLRSVIRKLAEHMTKAATNTASAIAPARDQ